MKTIPPSIIDQLNKTQKNFIWNGLNPKIKNSTINNNYENGRLKNFNIAAKIINLQSSWIKRLFDENFHDWKILPLPIIHKSLGKKFVFHSNLKVNKKLTKSFPKYYREIINTWGSKFSCQTLVPSAILSQFLWFNSQVQIGNKSVFFSSFSERNINFVGQLFKTDGTVKPWKQLQEEYGLASKLKFKWIQIIHSLSKSWIEQIFIDSGNSINLAIQDHHLIKKHQILCLNKLDSKELYNVQLLANFLKPTSQAYFEKIFVEHVFEWDKIYILPRIVTTDSRIRIFQYNILHNVLYLNKNLFEFNKINSPECPFCKCEEETTIHLFHICRKTQALWTKLTGHLNRHLNLPHLTPQSAIFGFLDISNKDYLIVNHLLLLFKYYIYNYYISKI